MKNDDATILPLSVDATGKINFDSIVKLSENATKTVFSRHSDLVPKIGLDAAEKTSKEEEEKEEARVGK